MNPERAQSRPGGGFRFLHAADLHLDSKLRGLERYEGAPVEQIRNATRRAMENLVRLAVEERVAFVLIAGDVYDGDWKDYNTGLFFAARMTALREAGIRVFLISGNHDAISQITRTLKLPDNVRVLSTTAPETVIWEECGVAVHGQGFATRAVPDDISARYPAAAAGLFNIGILHTSADGRDGHDVYAPCRPDGLAAKDYQYWALGHIHKREELRKEPWIVFPGNIQGRHIREAGPKGCTLVTVEDNEVVSAEHRDLDVLRWVLCNVDVAGVRDTDDMLYRLGSAVGTHVAAADGRPLAMRVNVSGAGRVHERLADAPDKYVAEIRNAARDAGAGKVWVEKVKLDTSSALDVPELSDQAVGGLMTLIDEIRGDDAGLVKLFADEFGDLKNRLPAAVWGDKAAGIESALDLDDPGRLRAVLDDVKQLLLPRFAGPGEGT